MVLFSLDLFGFLGDNFTNELSGTAFGIYNLGVYVGYSTIISLGTYIFDTYNWEAGYYIFGLVGVVVGLISMVFVSDPRYPSIFPSKNAQIQEETVNLRDGDMLVESNGENGEGSKKGRGFSDACLKTKEIFSHWWTNPCIIAICIASSFRNGAGTIWAYYTAVFFSSKWEYDSDHDKTCWYSNTNSSSLDCGGAPECCSSSHPYCVDGSCADLSTFPWHNEGMTSIQFVSYISWVPFVGMALGAMVGGYVSDILVEKWGPKARLIILSLTNFIAAPLVIGVVYLDYPWCFLIWIPCGFIGEAWIGTALASIRDLTPSHLTVTSTAIFMFFLTIIGGNMPLLV